MPPLIAAILVWVLLASCQGAEAPTKAWSLRVAATWGLAPFELRLSRIGTNASLEPLVYEPLNSYVQSTERSGTTVMLRLKEDTTESASTLAAAFRLRSLVESVAIDPHTIRVTFSLPEAAERVAALQAGGFDLGAFRMLSESATTLALERRGKGEPRKILVEEMTSQDEWRRFLGGQLNVMPRASSLHRRHLESMHSVRLADYPVGHELGLHFNLNSELLSDVRVRRMIADAIDRPAIARVATGQSNLAVAHSRSMESHVTVFSSPLRLMYLRQDDDVRQVAEVIWFQLSEKGIPCKLMDVSIEELASYFHSGDSELTLLPSPLGERRYDSFTTTSDMSVSSHLQGEYDAAYQAKDYATLDRILAEDLPVTLLYTQSYFAAIHSDLCIADKLDPVDWKWLASVHPCNTERNY